MAKKKKSKAVWAKNKADHEARQQKKTEWAKKATGLKQRRMKSIDGKTRTYLTKTDSRGRMRIIDRGGVAPAGYVSGSKGYYGLKKNLKLTRNSSDAQKTFYAAHQAEIMGAHPEGTDVGAIDRMGRRGQVNAERGTVYANFRTDKTMRRLMDDAKAWYSGKYPHAGAKGRKMSKNILSFGQDGREA